MKTYVDGTDEVFVSHEDVGDGEAKNDGADPCTYKTLHSLLRRQLNELSAAECDTTNVCEDVIGDDQGCWQEEPYHAFEDVVHDEMRLDYDEVKSHVCPRELGELKTIMTFLKGAHEEDEACGRTLAL